MLTVYGLQKSSEGYLLGLQNFIVFHVGPAFYNILNYSLTTGCHKKGKKKKDAFGSTVPRLLYLVKREAFTTPGPADYQVLLNSRAQIITSILTLH